MFPLKEEKAFSFPSRRLRSQTPLTFQFILPELARRREGFFLVPQLAQGVHLLPPGCTEDFISPALARGRGGLYLVPLLCPGITSPLPWMH